MKHPTRNLLLAVIALLAIFSILPTAGWAVDKAPVERAAAPAADDAATTTDAPGSFLASISVASYGTINWHALAGGADLGAGISLEHRFSDRIGVRFSAEADSWQPHDYFLDRAWLDIKTSAPLSPTTALYGFGGFGYARKEHDVLARAGGGIETQLLRLDRVTAKLFLEGSLQTSTGSYRAAGLAGGISIGF